MFNFLFRSFNINTWLMGLAYPKMVCHIFLPETPAKGMFDFNYY